MLDQLDQHAGQFAFGGRTLKQHVVRPFETDAAGTQPFQGARQSNAASRGRKRGCSSARTPQVASAIEDLSSRSEKIGCETVQSAA